MKNFKNKVALVTGASSGIGEAIAVALASAGATVILTARDQEKLDAVRLKCISAGGKAWVHAAEVSDEAQMQALADTVHAQFPAIDILINNAGVVMGGLTWEVEAEDGRTWQARRVALNLPAPQAAALLGDVAPALAAELAQITYQPCWAVGAVLERDLDVTWPALYTRHPALDWIAREHTKRPGTAPALMLHAGPEWTRAHLDTPPGEVARLLLAAAAEVVGEPIQAQDTFAHRWLYAQPVTRHPAPFLWDPALGLGLCGDGFTPDEAPSRVEAALLSGWGLAALLQHS